MDDREKFVHEMAARVVTEDIIGPAKIVSGDATREERVKIAAKAIADHRAWRLDVPTDPNPPCDEDYEIAEAVIVALDVAP